MPAIPSLALARRIVKSYMNDSFLCVIIEGEERIGKTTLATKALNQALAYLTNKQIRENNWRNYMGWNASEVIEQWYSKPSNKKEIGFIWDDAGMWLNALQWSDPVLIQIQRYMNIIGTDYSFFCMTTPKASWILNKINGIPGIIKVIVKRTMGEDTIGEMEESTKWARVGKGYKPWWSPDTKRSGVRKILEDDFSCKMPDEMYAWYKPLRERYNDEIKKYMRHEMISQIRKGALRDLQQKTKGLRMQSQLNKLNKSYDKLEKEGKELPRGVFRDEDKLESDILSIDGNEYEEMEVGEDD